MESQDFYCGSWPGCWDDQESVIGIGSSSREWSHADSTRVKRKGKRVQEEDIFERISYKKLLLFVATFSGKDALLFFKKDITPPKDLLACDGT